MKPPIRIVLVRPRNPNNIGAVARAMKNFDFNELVIVAPHPPVWEEARVSAIGAREVIERARVVENLPEAISDCSLVIGTVDRRRGEGHSPAWLKAELSISPGPIAIVFGSEKSGLTNEDLSYCHHVASIPTSADCPSMNLGQAVAIFCYEFAGLGESEAAAVVKNPQGANATAGELEALLERTAVLLRSTGFLTETNEQRMVEQLRQSLLRTRLTSRDVKLWRGALRRILGKLEG